MYIGDFTAGDTIDFDFTTRTTTGVPTALAGGTMNVYKDNGSTANTAGTTLTVSVNSVVGFNNLHITTSSDTTFYAAGHNYTVMLSAGTVGGASVIGEVLCSFSLNNRTPTKGIYEGSVTGVSTSTTIVDSNLATQFPTSSLVGRAVIWITGANAGSQQQITAHVAGSSTLTTAAWGTVPVSTEKYRVF